MVVRVRGHLRTAVISVGDIVADGGAGRETGDRFSRCRDFQRAHARRHGWEGISRARQAVADIQGRLSTTVLQPDSSRLHSICTTRGLMEEKCSCAMRASSEAFRRCCSPRDNAVERAHTWMAARRTWIAVRHTWIAVRRTRLRLAELGISPSKRSRHPIASRQRQAQGRQACHK